MSGHPAAEASRQYYASETSITEDLLLLKSGLTLGFD